jgi:hypothetical protein
LVLWEPAHGNTSRGKHKLTFIDRPAEKGHWASIYHWSKDIDQRQSSVADHYLRKLNMMMMMPIYATFTVGTLIST